MQYLLPQIDVTTLIIIGENDYLIHLALSKIINENILASELKIISEACHISNLENRDEFNKYLLERSKIEADKNKVFVASKSEILTDFWCPKHICV